MPIAAVVTAAMGLMSLLLFGPQVKEDVTDHFPLVARHASRIQLRDCFAHGFIRRGQAQ